MTTVLQRIKREEWKSQSFNESCNFNNHNARITLVLFAYQERFLPPRRPGIVGLQSTFRRYKTPQSCNCCHCLVSLLLVLGLEVSERGVVHNHLRPAA